MKKYKHLIQLFLLSCVIIITAGCSKEQVNSSSNIILMVMAEKDFYELEYTAPRKRLEDLGFRIEVANVSGGVSIGINGMNEKADLAIKDADEKKYSSLLLVGGYGAESLYGNKELIKLIKAFNKSGKVIGAQCFTPIVVAQAGLLKGQKATCWESQSSKLESYGAIYTGNVTERIDNILTTPSGHDDNISVFLDEYVNMLDTGDNVISTIQSSGKVYLDLSNFDKIHLPVNGSDNEYLIMGNIPFKEPAKHLAPELKNFIGRWEGYDLRPPVTKDEKIVLVINEITEEEIRGSVMHTTNLQFFNEMNNFSAKIINKNPCQFEMQSSLLTHISSLNNVVFTFDQNNNQLTGGVKSLDKDIVLSRGDNFRVYKDYDKYLAGKNIFVKEYQEKNLQDSGKGFMYYLPKGYKEDKKKKWPLMVFLHGSGDIGDNIHILAKASPFMMIREKQDLPFIIAAPLLSLNSNGTFRAFPTDYMDDFITKISKEYRVDTSRIYVTGLSMGGEACYRYGIYHPERVAAIAPLCAPLSLENIDLGPLQQYYQTVKEPLSNLRNVPVWTIGGGKDPIVLKAAVLKIADEVKKSGVNIKISMLEENDHDVWTDTYTDPDFYKWFLLYKKN